MSCVKVIREPCKGGSPPCTGFRYGSCNRGRRLSIYLKEAVVYRLKYQYDPNQVDIYWDGGEANLFLMLISMTDGTIVGAVEFDPLTQSLPYSMGLLTEFNRYKLYYRTQTSVHYTPWRTLDFEFVPEQFRYIVDTGGATFIADDSKLIIDG